MTDIYKVWECKIVVPINSDLPNGFDSPPRMAAEKAITDAGFRVLANFSGWDGSLDEHHLKAIEADG